MLFTKNILPYNTFGSCDDYIGYARPVIQVFVIWHWLGECSTVDMTVSVASWSEPLASDPEVPGSIPGATRFPEKYWV
jgi:hypothetical protein